MPPRLLVAGLALAFAGILALHVVAADAAALRLREIFDAVHVAGFASIAAVTLIVAERLGARRAAALAVSAGAVAALGLVSEAAQLLTLRDASLGDLGRDAAGIVAGLAFVRAARSPERRLGLMALALAALGAGLFAPVRILVARGLAERAMPVLAGFERDLEAPFVHGSAARVERVPAPKGWPLEGRVARVTPVPGRRFPGIAFSDLPRDWSHYQALTFVVAAETAALHELTIRVHDSAHDDTFTDRFNRAFAVGTSPARVRIELADVRDAPHGRRLDLSRVEGIVIFSADAAAGSFLIDDLRLE